MLFFKTESHMVQAGIELTEDEFLTHSPHTRIAGTYYHAWFMWCGGLNPGLPVCYASTLSAELHSQPWSESSYRYLA